MTVFKVGPYVGAAAAAAAASTRTRLRTSCKANDGPFSGS